MDIGTNKLEIGNWKLKCKNNIQYSISDIPVHLINITYPDQVFSLAQYKRLAIQTIRNIHKKGKLPILVGGTGLYIKAIVYNLNIPKAPPSPKVRIKLEKQSISKLFKKLQKVDPKSAEIIGPHNKRKMIRALEVYEVTGRPFSSQQIKGKPLFDVCEIGIKIDREKLYKKIDKRVDLMIKDGLIDETKFLVKKYGNELPAMTGIGYKEINQYIKSEISLKEASQLIKFRTHQYARRQMTWFKRDGRIIWINNLKKAKEIVNIFLRNKPKKDTITKQQ